MICIIMQGCAIKSCGAKLYVNVGSENYAERLPSTNRDEILQEHFIKKMLRQNILIQ